MSRFANQLLARIHLLDIRLQGCRARLADVTDVEALHELRISLRTLRSLLRPLRRVPSVDLLEQAAANLGRRTNSIRERQVLVAELEQLGMQAVAAEHGQQLEPAIQQLLESVELSRFLEVLHGFAPIWRLAAREGLLHGLHRRIRQQFRRDLHKMPRHLDYTAADLHALRLKVKRLRYCSQVYPELTPLGRRELNVLRKMQQSLGDWNDCQHWLSCTAGDERLAGFRSGWLGRAQAAASTAGMLLKRLEKTGARTD